MNHAPDVERYLQNPSLLVDLCRMLVERLDAEDKKAETTAMEAQLREIARAIGKLEKQGVPVPDALRGEKTRLATELVGKGEGLTLMERFGDGLEGVVLDVRQRCGRDGDKKNEKKTRGKRTLRPKTDSKTLRQHILKALRALGGRAPVRQVLEEMGNQLEGKLLPGDLEWRESANEYVWHNNTRWERSRMVKEGILKKETPSGIWEIA